MNKLLSADLKRLWKNKVLWTGAVIMLLWAACMLAAAWYSAGRYDAFYTLDDFFFQCEPAIGGFCAVIISLFLGTDYSDGTIRNKLMAGHSRKAVYLSNMLVSTVAGIVMNGVWFFTVLIIGVPLFGWFHASINVVLLHLLLTLAMVAALSSVFALVGMLNHRKAGAAVTSMLAFVIIMLFATFCYSRLCEPQMRGGYTMITDADGEPVMQEVEPEPNPYYIDGVVRTVFETIVDALPVGQGILLSNWEVARPWQMLLYSLLIVAGTTGVGIFCFQKKDIN